MTDIQRIQELHKDLETPFDVNDFKQFVQWDDNYAEYLALCANNMPKAIELLKEAFPLIRADDLTITNNTNNSRRGIDVIHDIQDLLGEA